jgi:hypothetical protein
MAMESLQFELLRFLKTVGATAAVIEDWELAWYRALEFPDEPLPCPSCFLDGRIERLVPSPIDSQTAAVRCMGCGAKFASAG